MRAAFGVEAFVGEAQALNGPPADQVFLDLEDAVADYVGRYLVTGSVLGAEANSAVAAATPAIVHQH